MLVVQSYCKIPIKRNKWKFIYICEREDFIYIEDNTIYMDLFLLLRCSVTYLKLLQKPN